MTPFNEANTVEALIRDTLCGILPTSGRAVSEEAEPYQVGDRVRWRYVAASELPCLLGVIMSM